MTLALMASPSRNWVGGARQEARVSTRAAAANGSSSPSVRRALGFVRAVRTSEAWLTAVGTATQPGPDLYTVNW